MKKGIEANVSDYAILASISLSIRVYCTIDPEKQVLRDCFSMCLPIRQVGRQIR